VTEIIFLLALFLLILVVALMIFVLFAGPSLWVYACIFVLLFFLWYKPLLVLYHSFKAGHMLKQMDFEGVSAQYNKMTELKAAHRSSTLEIFQNQARASGSVITQNNIKNCTLNGRR
jgi:hypothetical protein